MVRQSIADSDEIDLRCVTDASCKLVVPGKSTQTARRDVPVVFRFRAKVADSELLPTKIRFDATARSNPDLADSVAVDASCRAAHDYTHRECRGNIRGTKF